MSPEWITLLVEWLATYVLHSTLLCAGAWLLASLARRMGPRLGQMVWRTALFGGIVTATLHVGFGAPLWQTPIVQAGAATDASRSAATAETGGASPLVLGGYAGAESNGDSLLPPLAEPTSAPALTPSPLWLLALWPMGIAWLLWRRRHVRRRVTRDLAGRRPLRRTDLVGTLRGIEREANLARRTRLTTASSLASPIAWGTWRPEICLPNRALRELSPALLEAMLAHEVAHLARRDPAWLRVYRGVTALLFFQPLNHLAVSRLRDASEMLCDAWASRRSSRRLALAECLTAVADWILERGTPAAVPAMARKASLLGERVRRLLDADGERGQASPGIALLVALLPLVLVGALAPGVTGALDATAATIEVSPASDIPSALSALDSEIGRLDREIRDVQDLLESAGHPALATRLEVRRHAVRARRADLGNRIEGKKTD